MKKLITMLAVLMLVLAFAPVASAATQGSCSPQSNRVSLRVWEDPIGDTSDGNDSLWLLCNTSAPAHIYDLTQWSHTLPGGCESQHPFHGSNWNDCIESYTIWGMASSLWRICWYKNANFGADMSFVSGPLTNGSRHDFDYTFDEEISSLKVMNSGTCAG